MTICCIIVLCVGFGFGVANLLYMLGDYLRRRGM